MNRPTKPHKTASFDHELTRLTTRRRSAGLLLEEKWRLNFLCALRPTRLPSYFFRMTELYAIGISVNMAGLVVRRPATDRGIYP
jgi:hypothetical protein